jgi:hypothetical protein
VRALHRRRVSWGTFNDALCVNAAQLHCNAHVNNLVVLSPTTTTTTSSSSSSSITTNVMRSPLLAPLDFDMAFEVAHDEAGDALLLVEHLNFAETLAGNYFCCCCCLYVLICYMLLLFFCYFVGADASTGVSGAERKRIEQHSEVIK